MGRLIDSQTAYDVLTDYYHHTTDTQHAALREALGRVESVDAVPVVRCKNCIHWGKYPVSTVLPQYHKCGMATYKSTMDDDFCSDGRNSDPEPLKGGKNMCNYKIFSKMLKEQIKKKGMTQKELAERIDITEASVSRYVSGQRIPKATVLLKIATALGVSTDYLLGVEEKDDDNAEGHT